MLQLTLSWLRMSVIAALPCGRSPWPCKSVRLVAFTPCDLIQSLSLSIIYRYYSSACFISSDLRASGTDSLAILSVISSNPSSSSYDCSPRSCRSIVELLLSSSVFPDPDTSLPLVYDPGLLSTGFTSPLPWSRLASGLTWLLPALFASRVRSIMV